MMTMVVREGIGKKKKMRIERRKKRKGVGREENFLSRHHLLTPHAAELFHSNSYQHVECENQLSYRMTKSGGRQ